MAVPASGSSLSLAALAAEKIENDYNLSNLGIIFIITNKRWMQY